MRWLLLLFLAVNLTMHVGCGTTDEVEEDSDIAEATSDEAMESDESEPMETAEEDLNAPAPEQAQGEPPPEDPTVQEPPPPEETFADTPPPEAAPEEVSPPSETPAYEEATPMADSGGGPAKIVALDYDGNSDGGTIMIRTDNPATYSTRLNPSTNQFVIELPNTTVPKNFRRPYNTKEFGGPIASFTAYQGKGGGPARIVVQMRSPGSEPTLTQEGNMIRVSGAGLSSQAAAPSEEDTAPPVAEDSGGEAMAEAPPQEESYEEQPGDASQVLTNKSISDFLTGNIKFYGRPISLEFRDADLKDVFRFIAEETGVNLLVGDDVSGKISLKLRKVPWDQALTVILQSKQLGYVKQGSILRIAPLKVLQAEADSARTVIEAQNLLRPLRIQLYPVSYAKAEDLEGQVKELLSTRGKVRADKRTNTLVVTDIEDNLAKVKKLVAKLDTQTPQVLIEAKIVEAREAFDRTIGVNWDFNGVDSGGVTPKFASNPARAGATAELGVTVGGLDVIGDLTASLKLLESERMVKVISAPRIVTSDRKEARIEQSTQFPINNSIQGTAGFVGSTTTFQDVKLQLTVTPQVAADGGVTMDVLIVREFPESEAGQNGARAINKRQAATQVLVESGDTVVIGGIYQSDVGDSEEGVPFFKNIPLLGWLFKRKTVNREKNELVIFLTPRILNRDKAFIRGGEA